MYRKIKIETRKDIWKSRNNKESILFVKVSNKKRNI